MHIFRLLSSLLLFIVFSSNAEEYDKLPLQTDRTFYGLKGAVAGITEVKWIPSPDSTVFSSVATINVDKTYAMERSEEMIFDGHGAITKRIIKESEGRKKNKINESVRLFYYLQGKLVAVSNLEENKKTDSVAFHYKKKGQMDNYRLFNNKQDVVYTVDYVYKNGKIFSVRKRDDQRLPVSTIKYKYKDDQLVETQHFNGQSQKTETRNYSTSKAEEDGKVNDSYSVLDERGNMKEGLLLVKDKAGRILERNVISDERKVTEYNGYEYDEKGNPATEKIFNSLQELTITNRYTYDDTGNWVRKDVFYNGILKSVVLRDIKYN